VKWKVYIAYCFKTRLCLLILNINMLCIVKISLCKPILWLLENSVSYRDSHKINFCSCRYYYLPIPPPASLEEMGPEPSQWSNWKGKGYGNAVTTCQCWHIREISTGTGQYKDDARSLQVHPQAVVTNERGLLLLKLSLSNIDIFGLYLKIKHYWSMTFKNLKIRP